jgi:hypothetical protein
MMTDNFFIVISRLQGHTRMGKACAANMLCFLRLPNLPLIRPCPPRSVLERMQGSFLILAAFAAASFSAAQVPCHRKVVVYSSVCVATYLSIRSRRSLDVCNCMLLFCKFRKLRPKQMTSSKVRPLIS